MPQRDKTAHAKYMRDYYAKNRKKWRADATERAAAKRRALAERKAETGCARCPENDPRCLHFHHRDPSDKAFTIGVKVATYSLERLMAEADKCDVLCANCHMKEHNV